MTLSLAEETERRRKCSVAEIHRSELRYLKRILLLEKVYLPILVTGSADQPVDLVTHTFDEMKSVISRAQAQLLFGHVISIRKNNEAFFQDFTEIVKDWHSDSLLGGFMLNFAASLVLYTDFLRNVSYDLVGSP